MLSTTCEYALRALVILAREKDGFPTLGKDLAEQADVPPNYLSKILNTLRHAGILEATRGTGGGYRLRRTPDEIRLIDVVEVFDSTTAKPACVLGSSRDCDECSPCSAHARWRDVRKVYIDFLESTTLSSIADAPPVVAVGATGTVKSPRPTTISGK